MFISFVKYFWSLKFLKSAVLTHSDYILMHLCGSSKKELSAMHALLLQFRVFTTFQWIFSTLRENCLVVFNGWLPVLKWTLFKPPANTNANIVIVLLLCCYYFSCFCSKCICVCPKQPCTHTNLRTYTSTSQPDRHCIGLHSCICMAFHWQLPANM